MQANCSLDIYFKQAGNIPILEPLSHNSQLVFVMVAVMTV